MSNKPFTNREISWIEFNQRVLEEAQRENNPLLERLKFLAITGSNLDEFFQVRIGGLTLMRQEGLRKPDPAGLTPTAQLKLIRQRVLKMMNDQYTLLNDELLPKLSEEGVHITTIQKLPENLKQQVQERFELLIAPLLTPIAYSQEEGIPFFHSLQLCVLCELDQLHSQQGKKNKNSEESRLTFIPIPSIIDRFIILLGDEGETYIITLENVITSFASSLFPEEKVAHTATFRITRNGDVVLQKEDATDLANEMEDILAERETSQIIRLEIQSGAARHLFNFLRDETQASTQQLFRINGPIGLNEIMPLAFMSGYDHLRDESWEPQPSPIVDPQLSMFDNITQQDILLHHPYESFDPVIRMIEEAAKDPQTLSIKQVLYRTAKKSRIVDALIQAANNGKDVTVLVELKARFDEANNLQRADELRRAGVRIIYGVKNLKTHAKIALIIRNENGTLRRYMHLGTGNYNESTAKIYTDISYLTCNNQYGADSSAFFNAVTGRSQVTRFNKLLPAPMQMKKSLLEMIASEAERAKQGDKAHIIAKINSLQDTDIINALYKASKAGVKIQLNIRGICCLQPQKGKTSSNIEVVSVIDRYLEHARIFYFYQGGKPKLFIASADWMTRNLEKRVELMIPIEDPVSKKRLIHILESAFKDNQNAHSILADGTSKRIEKKGKKFRLQAHLQSTAEAAYKELNFKRTTTLEPHTPS